MLPLEIVSKILDLTDDLNNYKCHTCNKKIKCIDYKFKYNKLLFCSLECFNFT